MLTTKTKGQTMTRRSTFEPRYIRPEVICIGDTIKVTYPATDTVDVERSTVGTVHSRDRVPPFQTMYYTANNVLLLHHVLNVKPDYRITLLDRVELDTVAALF